MNAAASVDKSARTPGRGKSKVPGGPGLGQDASREARQRGAAILEVLAGLRTPAQAASAIAVSLPCYYLLESRALAGLLAACEVKPKGRVRSAASEVTALRQDNERLQREVARQQALVRLAQRSIGLAPPAAPVARAGKKTRKRRPVARALSVAQRLRQDHVATTSTPAAVSEAPMNNM